ncbi:LysR family transcriptional regulator [Marinivivus vitaminiproducens]|uniref:LysR family transcriptional regulator n=1 Tax=Marinivivus vitaminiproducens TaxID=3035935 RepID=UPI0027A8C6EB|nr:LysR family transcriptional regulator [Geminicoccaceae bacterium SCSIO 64248]
MDRIEAMRLFLAVLDTGSQAEAGRRLGHSAPAVSRAIASLETRLGTPLLHRTTRSLRLSEAGERYAAACRRILADIEEADLLAAGERSAPRGMLTLTAPLVSGARLLRPVLDDFLDSYSEVRARLILLDRPVGLIDEGIDIALRIAHLPDSSLIATRVGEIRRIVVASPRYLAARPALTAPDHLARHACISLTRFDHDAWAFSGPDGRQLRVALVPRFVVNGVEAAVASALEGRGVTRVLSYQVADHVREGRLVRLLADAEPPPVPAHLVTPEGRLGVPKVRAFVDFAVPRLRQAFADRALPPYSPA